MPGGGSGSLGVAPEIDMQPGGKPVATLFTEISDPAGAFRKCFGVGSLGHEQHIFGLNSSLDRDAGVHVVNHFFNLDQIFRSGEHEFPLTFRDHPPAAICKILEYFEIQSLLFVERGKPA